MWTVPIKPYSDVLKICEEETLKFRRNNLPQVEVHVFCCRILTQEEKALVLATVCIQLLQNKPAASVKLDLAEGDFPVAVRLLEDALSQLLGH